MEAEESDIEDDNRQDELDYDAIEEELDLHVPMIGDDHDNDNNALLPNGFHNDDDDDSSSSDGNFDDEEIPIQPRIMLGGVMAVLGHQHRVDDSSSDEEENEDDNDDAENREIFDNELPSRHAYLGEGREVGGRTILDEDLTVNLPLYNQPGVDLVPGQQLPLHLFHPSVISMMRTVIETTKIFGVVSLKADSTSWKGLVGTTAEIFEYIDTDDNTVSNEDPRSVGLKMRVRGRQRFKLVSTRRQVDGNLVGEVKMLVDRDLGEPDEDIRIPSWNRFMKIEAESPSSNKSSPEDENAKKSCFSFLSLLRSSSSLSTSSTSQSSHSPSLRMKRKHPSHVTSPIPPWIWDMYSPSNLVLRVKQELSKLSSLSPNMSSVPSDPTQLSWWATANLPFEDDIRTTLLSLNCPVQRLRVTLSFLSQCRVLVCRKCGKQLGDQKSIFSMSKEGPQGAFVNPGGHVHETLTLYKAKNLRLVGRPSTEYSWFPGYAWTITECLGCWSHIGWKFTSTNPKLRPEKFYGFSRKNIDAKAEVPETGDSEEDPNDEANKTRYIM